MGVLFYVLLLCLILGTCVVLGLIRGELKQLWNYGSQPTEALGNAWYASWYCVEQKRRLRVACKRCAIVFWAAHNNCVFPTIHVIFSVILPCKLQTDYILVVCNMWNISINILYGKCYINSCATNHFSFPE